MNQQEVHGKVKKAQGKVKETVGILTGNKKMEHGGSVQRAEGAVQRRNEIEVRDARDHEFKNLLNASRLDGQDAPQAGWSSVELFEAVPDRREQARSSGPRPLIPYP